MADHKHVHDPDWGVIDGKFVRVLSVDDRPTAIGIGSFRCEDCAGANVVIAAMGGNVQMEVGLEPEAARILALDILARLDALGEKPVLSS